MGFVENAYNVLSPASLAAPWLPHSSDSPSQDVSNHKDSNKLAKEEDPSVDCNCRSWILGRLNLVKNSNSSKNLQKNHGGYQRPPQWKRLMRKWRAHAKKAQSSCYESICTEPQPRLHHYKTESYERNFDRGREYWQDLPFLDISPFCSPTNHRMTSSSSPETTISSSSSAVIAGNTSHMFGWDHHLAEQQQHLKSI